jgi:ankyrin repeat protein
MACKYIVCPEPSPIVRLILCYRFRWAACQLPTLEKCLDLPMLEKRLATFPSTLAETYSRILGNIPDDYRPNAIKILQFLTYSEHPISLEEAVDIVATDPVKEPSFQVRNRMRKANETLLLCSSLVTRILIERSAQTEERIEMHLAHSSVKEFLISGTTKFEFCQQLKEDAARASIVQVCLAYLSSLELGPQLQRIRLDYPLAQVSAKIWMSSAAAAESNKGARDMILKFFANDSRGYANWRRFQTNPATSSRYASGRRAPFYHVARLGLYQTMEVLLQSNDHDPIQAHDFTYALSTATRAAKTRMVELLLQCQQRFYNVSKNERFASALNVALREASSLGHEQIVKILIHQGASVIVRGVPYETALQVAAAEGHKSIVMLLLNTGADPDARGRKYGTALFAAASGNRDQVVQILLARGADTAFKHKIYGTALRAACVHNNARIVGMLLKNDANNNKPGRCYAEELHTALTMGHDKIVQMLLDRGARLTFEVLLAIVAGHPAPVGSSGKHCAMMERMSYDRTRVDPFLPCITKDLVSERDAGNEKTLLHWAAEMGLRPLADRCLELGAKVDTTDVYGETALHYAAQNGHVDIVHLLVQANANKTIVDSHGRTASDCAQGAGPGIGRRIYPDIVAYLQQ